MCQCNKCYNTIQCNSPCSWCEQEQVNTHLPTPCITGCEDDFPAKCVLLTENITVCGKLFKKGISLEAVIKHMSTCEDPGEEPVFTAYPDFVTTQFETPSEAINVLTNDTVDCGGTFEVQVLNSFGGTVSPMISETGEDFVFTPNDGFSGLGTFVYQVFCNAELIASSTVYVQVESGSNFQLANNSEFNPNTELYKQGFNYDVTLAPTCGESDVYVFIVSLSGENTEEDILNNVNTSPLNWASITDTVTDSFSVNIEDIITEDLPWINDEGLTNSDFSSMCQDVYVVTKVINEEPSCSSTQIIKLSKNMFVNQQIDFKTSILVDSWDTEVVVSLPVSGDPETIYITDDSQRWIWSNGWHKLNLFEITTSMGSVDPNDNTDRDTTFINWGDSFFTNHFNTGLDSTDGGVTSEGLRHYYDNSDNTYTGKLVAKCTARIEEIEISGGLAPTYLKVPVGADLISNISNIGSFTFTSSLYDFEGMYNLESIIFKPELAYKSATAYSLNNIQDLVKLEELEIEGVKFTNTGIFGNKFIIVNNDDIINIVYNHSVGIQEFDLGVNNTVNFELQISELSHLNSANSLFESLVLQDSIGANFYGESTKSKIDRITFKPSGEVWGDGFYDFSALENLVVKDIRGLDSLGVATPTLINTTAGAFTPINTDPVKDEIFISLDLNGLTNGTAELSDIGFGEHVNSYLNSNAYYFPTWDDQNRLTPSEISFTIGGGEGDFSATTPTVTVNGTFDPTMYNQYVSFHVPHPSSSEYNELATGYVQIDGTGHINIGTLVWVNVGALYPDNTYTTDLLGDGTGHASTDAKTAIDNLNTKNWTLKF